MKNEVLCYSSNCPHQHQEDGKLNLNEFYISKSIGGHSGSVLSCFLCFKNMNCR
ncbi:MAG: hypothetical protein ACPKPY_05990 [Nitrososphaeraceae archaeon]